MEVIKSIVEDFFLFQDNFLNDPTRILRMASYEKEFVLHCCTKCLERGRILESKASKICHLCSEIETHLENIIKDLNLPLLVVYNQLITRKNLEKLKEVNLKRMVDVNTLKDVIKEIMDIFSILLEKTTARLKEAILYLDFRLN